MTSVLLGGTFVPNTQVFSLVTVEEVRELQSKVGQSVVNVSKHPSYVFEDLCLYKNKYTILPGGEVTIVRILGEFQVAEVRVQDASGIISLEQLQELMGKSARKEAVQVEILPRKFPVPSSNYQNLTESVRKKTCFNLPPFPVHDGLTEGNDMVFQLDSVTLPHFSKVFYTKLVDGFLPKVDVSADQARLPASIYIFGIGSLSPQIEVRSCIDRKRMVKYTRNASFYDRFNKLSPENKLLVLRYFCEYHRIFIRERDALFNNIPGFAVEFARQRGIHPRAPLYRIIKKALEFLGEDISERMPFTYQICINFLKTSDQSSIQPRVKETNCKWRLLTTLEQSLPLLSAHLKAELGFKSEQNNPFRDAYHKLLELASEQTVIEVGNQSRLLSPELISASTWVLAVHGVNRSQGAYLQGLGELVSPEYRFQLLEQFAKHFLALENVDRIIQILITGDPNLEDAITNLFSTEKFTLSSLCARSGICNDVEIENVFLGAANSDYAVKNEIEQKLLDFVAGGGMCTFHDFLTATDPQGQLLAHIIERTPFFDSQKPKDSLRIEDGEFQEGVFDRVYSHARALLFILMMVREGILIPEDTVQYEQATSEVKRLEEQLLQEKKEFLSQCMSKSPDELLIQYKELRSQLYLRESDEQKKLPKKLRDKRKKLFYECEEVRQELSGLPASIRAEQKCEEEEEKRELSKLQRQHCEQESELSKQYDQQIEGIRQGSNELHKLFAKEKPEVCFLLCEQEDNDSRQRLERLAREREEKLSGLRRKNKCQLDSKRGELACRRNANEQERRRYKQYLLDEQVRLSHEGEELRDKCLSQYHEQQIIARQIQQIRDILDRGGKI